MTLVALSALLTAAAPIVGLHVSAAVKLPEQREEDALAFVQRALVAGAMEVRPIHPRCEGEVECVLKLARAGGARAVVLVTLAATDKGTAVDLEALAVSDGQRLAVSTFKLDAKPSAQAQQALRKLVETLRTALSVAPKDGGAQRRAGRRPVSRWQREGPPPLRAPRSAPR
jgi:hypothetical protein